MRSSLLLLSRDVALYFIYFHHFQITLKLVGYKKIVVVSFRA